MNVVLLGMPGCGKSSLGKRVAGNMRIPYVDMDQRISDIVGCTVSEMFERYGEQAFRNAETNTLIQLTRETPSLISTGGGTVLQGKILTGVSGVAGEIGHMTIDPYETEYCGCGKKGCLEQYASATGMVRIAERFLQESKEDSVLRGKEKIMAKKHALKMRIFNLC